MKSQISYTKHAETRYQQRAISPFIIGLVMDHGRVVRRSGADLYFLDKSSRRALKKDLGAKVYSRIADQLDVYVVADTSVVTAAHRTKRIKH